MLALEDIVTLSLRFASCLFSFIPQCYNQTAGWMTRSFESNYCPVDWSLCVFPDLRILLKAEELDISGLGDTIYSLDVKELDEDSVLKFDLSPLYITSIPALELESNISFLNITTKIVLLQLNSDLQICSSTPFVESY
ncbi:hypothetical protein GQ457_11G011480 [Hibiscus cannabinus]